MFLALVGLISLILALAARRPVKDLLRRRFRYIGLLCIGAGIQALFVRPAVLPVLSASLVPGLPQTGGLLYIASLCMLLAFGWANRRVLGVALISAGLLLNTVAIAANFGQMPVDSQKASATGLLETIGAAALTDSWASKVLAGPDVRLGFLADWIVVPQLSGHPAILSPGDVLIVVGVVLFFMVISDAQPRGVEAVADF